MDSMLELASTFYVVEQVISIILSIGMIVLILYISIKK